MNEQSERCTNELPELYVRVNVQKNSRGVTTDKTVSVRGNITPEELTVLLGQVSGIADMQIEQEKRRLESVDI